MKGNVKEKGQKEIVQDTRTTTTTKKGATYKVHRYTQKHTVNKAIQ